MDISIDDVMDEEMVLLDITETDRDATINAMADRMDKAGRLSDRDEYVEAVLRREQEGDGTGMEMGVAIPHGKSSGVKTASVAFARSEEGIDFGGGAGPCRLVFLIAAPDGTEDMHVKLLSKLARKLVHESFRQSLLDADTEAEVMDIIRSEVTL